MSEDPKETIYIDISASPGRGKTTIARILKECLENLEMSVKVKDIDLSEGTYVQLLDLCKKAMSGRNVVIRTRQFPRNIQKGPDGEVPPGRLTTERFTNGYNSLAQRT